MKKVSTISKDGHVTWLMREVTKLACPSLDVPATLGASDDSESTKTYLSGTNKKMRLSKREQEDQSQPSKD